MYLRSEAIFSRVKHRANRRWRGGRSGLGQLGEGELIAHFPHEFGHPYVQRVADRGEQLGGSLLLPPLHLGELAERDSGGRGDFAQSTALALALPTQHVTQQATEHNHRWLPPRTT